MLLKELDNGTITIITRRVLQDKIRNGKPGFKAKEIHSLPET